MRDPIVEAFVAARRTTIPGNPHGWLREAAEACCEDRPQDRNAMELAVRVLAVLNANLLATREEWAEGWVEEDGEPEHWPIPVAGCSACEDAKPNYRRYVTEWRRADDA